MKEKDKDIIKAVIGPRRAGKSSFVIHELSGSGSWGYINFDDENLVDLEDYNELIENMKSVYGNPKILFLDEIQNLKKWELFVNRLQRQGFNIIVSGSNANLLSQELATHLTGRHLTTNVFPLSFKEFLSFFGKREDMTERLPFHPFRRSNIQGYRKALSDKGPCRLRGSGSIRHLQRHEFLFLQHLGRSNKGQEREHG